MKPIGLDQWLKMGTKKRSWLVCRALNLAHASVYWELIHPTQGQIGGSYQSLDYCENLIRTAKALPKKEVLESRGEYPHPVAQCAIRVSVAFPLYAEYDHLAVHVLNELLKSGAHVTLTCFANNGGFTAVSSAHKVAMPTLQETISLLALIIKGLIK